MTSQLCAIAELVEAGLWLDFTQRLLSLHHSFTLLC